MAHPLIDQLRFTRSELSRGLEGVDPDEGSRHFGPMNCIAWIVGHLAWQEQAYWLYRAQGELLYQELNDTYAYGAPMSTPDLSQTLTVWREIVQATEAYLDGLTAPTLLRQLPLNGQQVGQTIGSALLRMTYHYWYHLGEIQAVRQLLGHEELPEYVGSLEKQAPFQPA